MALLSKIYENYTRFRDLIWVYTCIDWIEKANVLKKNNTHRTLMEYIIYIFLKAFINWIFLYKSTEPEFNYFNAAVLNMIYYSFLILM